MNNGRKLALALGIALLMVGMVFAPASGNVLVEAPGVTKELSHTEINFGQGVKETTVEIEVSGAGEDQQAQNFPMDVVFSLDSSGSMGWNDPAGDRKTASKAFVDLMDDSTDTAGVVSWDSNVDFTFGLSADFVAVKANIDAVDSSGGTSLNAGLWGAIGVLNANPRLGDSSEVIIFLTDGQGAYTWSGQPGSPADAAAAAGYVIYTIGLGAAPSAAILTDIATTTGGTYYNSPDPGNLGQIFADIFTVVGGNTVPYYVDVIEVTQPYIVGHSNFNWPPDSIVTALDGTTTITWLNVGTYLDGDPDLSDDEILFFTFDVWSTQYGIDLPVQVEGDAVVEYTDEDGENPGSVDIPQAYLTVNPYTTDLIAGGGNVNSAIDVGELIVWNDLDYLYVKYVTTDGWWMTETHLHVVDEASDDEIPQKNGNPTPGKFDYSAEHDPAVQEYTYMVPWTWDSGTNLEIAAHAVVQKMTGYDEYGDPIYQEETAWADGEDFTGKNWATWFLYEDP
ncbi:MAG: VWA domain-containing protein [Thermoplasmata archaeon]|nr:MAG: VWA domain-containing protein [Thermoplasmata archaeon]